MNIMRLPIKIMMRTFGLWLCLLFLLNIVSVQAETKPPFLYYYSDSQSALVIERADGTDSRILTEIDSAEDSKMVIGPGWSPSGKWLAVNVVFVIQGFYYHSLDAFVIEQSGQSQLSVMEDSQPEVEIDMTWSPVEDILLAEYSYYDAVTHGPEKRTIKLFDLTTQRITLEYDLPGNPQAMFKVEWASDGQSLHIFYLYETDKTYLRTISLTGQTLQERRIDTSCGRFQGYPSPDNRVVAVVVDEVLMLTGTTTSDVIKSLPFSQSVVRLVNWSLDSQYALVYTASSCEDIPNQLWLLTTPDFETQLLLDNVDLSAERFPGSVWSACQQGFAVSEKQLYLITTEPAEARLIELPAEKMLSFTAWDNCNLLVAVYNYETGAKFYNFISEANLLAEYPLKELPQAIRYASISPTKTYIAYADYPHSYIENTITGQNTEIVLLDNNRLLGMPYGFMQVVWHPNQDWFLTLMDSESEHLINVVSADTGIQRELTLCFNARSCFGWLPA